MRPHVMQVKVPAVGFLLALCRDHFFFSSATRSDSKCCIEALHIACHDDLSPANVSGSFGSRSGATQKSGEAERSGERAW